MTTTHSQTQGYTLVVGLGVTGLSVVRYLSSLGEPVVVADSRDIPPGMNELKQDFQHVALNTGAFDEKLFRSARRIILSPGVSLDEKAVVAAREQGIEIIGDLDLFAHEVAVPVIGITGSNGKSTVTALLTAMAQKAGIKAVMAGNIGTAVLDALDSDAELYVLELSSFQLETLHRLPMIASVVLNISPDHMDRYTDFAAYAASKLAIYEQARQCVINLDDSALAAQAKVVNHPAGFSLQQPAENEFGVCQRDGARHICFGEQSLLDVSALRIKGEHNIANALAALSLGRCAELPMQAMLDALVEFAGLSHRMQWVAEIDGVNWYNDSKATNVGAAVAAITGLPGKHVLIAGGEAKQADFSDLQQVAAEYLSAVVLIGRDAASIEAAIGGVVTCEHATDMQQAVSKARELASAGENVLLSPACASFDMFDNFEHRGEVFVQAVEALR